MFAVKAIYDRGKIQFLEPLPEIEHAVLAVIFMENEHSDVGVTAAQDVLGTVVWGEPMDKEGAAALLALNEELAPYRAEAEAILTAEKEFLP